eukprot:NODE_658_length_1876_cov_64.453202_g529_i0.p2 GENE.NODE_658_length_1876_cov_64.453202_g529_i0~~NODE_658_length_1876_cov_64.453202_g529_i0.p2  ORF type:complete len:501 (+),score=137.39 NODE_658_length_1876_cov_64.453202_g529_i0:165-1667(+)
MAVVQRPFSLVVAVDAAGGIGKDGTVPWRCPTDMAFFKKATATAPEGTRNACIMGRRTWESIPSKFRPLKDRLSVVVSSSLAEPADNSFTVAPSLNAALDLVSPMKDVSQIFVIGGARMYEESLSHPMLNYCAVTSVSCKASPNGFDCDVSFPADRLQSLGFEQQQEHKMIALFQKCLDEIAAKSAEDKENAPEDAEKDSSIHCSFALWGRANPEEKQYLDLVRKVVATGLRKGDRTGVGTISIFGNMMRFSLRNGRFPLLTTKRVFLKGIVEELIWFIRGDTDGKRLSEKGVRIWDGNGSREFLDNLGFTDRREGDLGPIYGFQWRHFGAEYEGPDADYTGKGVDQLMKIIETIKTNPNDRRMIMSAWNPVAIPKMALPPCHVMAQFYVADGELSCMMTQRSCDMGLGVPFNIASYSLLTCMIAHVTGLRPGDFIHSLGDTHVYSNHVEPLEAQLSRQPRPFPILRINPNATDIEKMTAEDFVVSDYEPFPTIKMEMAV